VPLLKDSKDIRKLTPRECARFQGYPDSFKFDNDMAKSHIYKQIGNSVTVNVIKSIAIEIKKAMTCAEK
jgi:DNA (cytosine-5)-methyltransferase 1